MGAPRFAAAARGVPGCGAGVRAQGAGCLARAGAGVRRSGGCRGHAPLRARPLNPCRVRACVCVRVCVCVCVCAKRGGGRKWGGGGSGWRGGDYWQWAGEKEATPVSFSFCQRNLGSFSLSNTSSRTSYLASLPLPSWTSQVKRPFSSLPAGPLQKPFKIIAIKRCGVRAAVEMPRGSVEGISQERDLRMFW